MTTLQDAQAAFAAERYARAHDLSAGALEDRDGDRFESLAFYLMLNTAMPVRPDAEQRAYLTQLAAEAREIAATPVQQARAQHLTGVLAIITDGLRAGLEALRVAQALAEACGDPLARYLCGVDLGFFVAGQNLTTAKNAMLNAHALYENEVRDTLDETWRTIYDRSWHDLKGRIGIILYDLGDFEAGRAWMEASCENLRGTQLAPECYRVQPYTSMGLFEEAEAILRGAVSTDNPAEMNAWDLYNVSQIGKLYVEWGRPADALEILEPVWNETAKTGLAWLMTLVGNYYAEALLAEDVPAAAALAARIEDLARRTGWNRSVAYALLNRSRAAAALNAQNAALELSWRLIEFQNAFDTLPAVRKEEVLLNHALVLDAVGRHEQGYVYMQQARDILEMKLESIEDAAMRHSMMTNVSVSRAILGACG